MTFDPTFGSDAVYDALNTDNQLHLMLIICMAGL